jgi:hypothetical protein
MTPGGAAMMMGGRVPGQAIGTAANIVIELMETERKYVAELELLQVRSSSLYSHPVFVEPGV